MSVNKVILLGRLGQNPELKYTPSGSSVCNFSLATSESWKDKNNGQKQEKTEWHRIVVWGKLAELCHQYLSKGRQVFVEGRLQTRSWDDKTGNKKYTTEILASTVQFIGGPGESPMVDGPSPRGDEFMPEDDKSFSSHNNASAPSKDYNIIHDANFTADDIPF